MWERQIIFVFFAFGFFAAVTPALLGYLNLNQKARLSFFD